MPQFHRPGRSSSGWASKGMMVTYLVILLAVYICVSLYTVNRSLAHKVELLEEDLTVAVRQKKEALGTAEEIERTADSLKDKVSANTLEQLLARQRQQKVATDRSASPDIAAGNLLGNALKSENDRLKKELQELAEAQAAAAANAEAPAAAPAQKAAAAPAPAPEPPAPAPGGARKGGIGGGLPDEGRRAAIKQAMLHSWRGYEQYAWGQDELHPLSRSGNNWLGQGGTIVDSLDTLWIMGLKEEFEKGKQWVANSLHFNTNMDVSFFETTIRVLGGLLAAYEFSGDVVLLNKARELGDALMYAFNSPTGLPFSTVNLQSHGVSSPGWTGGSTVLAEVGTVQLEFNALSRHTKDPKYSNAAMKVFQHLKNLGKNQGLYPLYVDPHSGQFTSDQISLGAMGDSFYEYMIKVWLHRGKKDDFVKEMYDESMNGIMNVLVQVTGPSKLLYVAEMKGGGLVHKMDHLACFVGGMFALGSDYNDAQREAMLKVGAGIAETCFNMYDRMPSKLSPEFCTFGGGEEVSAGALYNIQRPETVETLFYMWRYTHDPKYREWGWKIFEAFQKWTKIESGGYVGVRDVRSVPPPQDDTMQTFWLAETLKYLYLLFSEDELIPLDQFVFNTEAHPLQVFDRDSV